GHRLQLLDVDPEPLRVQLFVVRVFEPLDQQCRLLHRHGDLDLPSVPVAAASSWAFSSAMMRARSASISGSPRGRVRPDAALLRRTPARYLSGSSICWPAAI